MTNVPTGTDIDLKTAVLPFKGWEGDTTGNFDDIDTDGYIEHEVFDYASTNDPAATVTSSIYGDVAGDPATATGLTCASTAGKYYYSLAFCALIKKTFSDPS